MIIEFVGNDLSLPNFIRKSPSPYDLGTSFLYGFVAARLRSATSNLEQLDQTPIVKWLQQHNVARAEWNPMSAGFASDPDEVPKQYRLMVGWQAYAGAMRELRQLSNRHGFQVLMLSLTPSNSQLISMALQQGRSEGFETLDIGEYLKVYLNNRVGPGTSARHCHLALKTAIPHNWVKISLLPDCLIISSRSF